MPLAGQVGRDSGPTAQAVAGFERGLCLDSGWQLGFLTLHAVHDLTSGSPSERLRRAAALVSGEPRDYAAGGPAVRTR